ncbi:WG repeat-containing protein [Dysgonomonas sp. 521]|uniref:WG repeat-containing protein n=1 Tax=Dysgonomonas sp. 521 TaxID=2302932 RepID=UPI0013D508A5|nr:WG repeat-containing protein [Dysgonomonas sp. 521]NDV97597.1 WG repeat-containing protein [Dysgonomonas sp. 521]
MTNRIIIFFFCLCFIPKAFSQYYYYGMYSLDGKVIVPCKYSRLGYVNDEIYLTEENGFYSFLNIKTKTSIKVSTPYRDIFKYSTDDLFIAVREVNKDKEKYDYCLIDMQGNIRSPYYDQITTIPNTDRYIVQKDEDYGIIDSSVHYIVPMGEYSYLSLEDNSIVATDKEQEKYGLLDSNGQWILPPVYDYIKKDMYISLPDNVLLAVLDKRKGLIYSDGSTLVPCLYDRIEHSQHGFHLVRKDNRTENSWGIIDLSNQGKEIIPCEFSRDLDVRWNHIFFKESSGWMGMMNMDGKQILPPVYQEIDSLAPELFRLKTSGWYYDKYGIADTLGNMLLPMQYNEIESRGQAIVIKKDKKYSLFIDGKLSDDYYDNIDTYSCGTYIVENNHKYGLLSQNGDILAPVIYDRIEYRGSCFVALKNALEYQIFDLKGQTDGVLYTSIVSVDYSGGSIIAVKGYRYGIVNVAGNIVMPFQYRMISFRNDLILVCDTLNNEELYYEENSKYHLLKNNKQKYALYSDMGSINDDYYKKAGVYFKKNEIIIEDDLDEYKWQMVTDRGKPISKLLFDEIQEYREGLFILVKDGKKGIIDRRGKVVVPFQYDEIEIYDKFIWVIKRGPDWKPILID